MTTTASQITTQTSSSIRSNIWKLYVIAATSDALFLIPVIFPFFGEHGLSYGQIMLLQVIYQFGMLMLEIPSGYLSDRWGRKPTLIAGSALGLVGMFIYGVATTFWGFLIGELLLAFMNSFYSGTKQALLSDTLHEIGENDQFRRLFGRMHLIRLSFQGVVSIVGGLLASIALSLTVWATLATFAIGFFVTLLLHEPRRHKLQEDRHLQVIWRIAKQSLSENVPLRQIIMLHTVISSLTLLLMWVSQPYQELVGLPLALFGLVHAVTMTSTGIMASAMHRLKDKVDDRLILMTIAGIIIFSYFTLSFISSLWGIVLLFTGRTMWGAITPITSEMVNKMATSDIRATVFSIQSFGNSLLNIPALLFFGYGLDALPLSQVIMGITIFGGLALLIIFARLAPNWEKLPQ